MPVVYAPTPSRTEAAWIRWRLDLAGDGVTAVARRLRCNHGSVSGVIDGRWHSARIEAEIARVIGCPSWTEMLMALRAEEVPRTPARRAGKGEGKKEKPLVRGGR